jgi:transposase
MHYIGMDVHKRMTALCVLDENGKKARESQVRGPRQALLETLQELRKHLGGPIRVCYEASGGCGWLFDQLVKLGLQVQVAHPAQLRLIYRTKRKNDRIDAHKLAVLLFLDQVPLVYVPESNVREWRRMIEYRQSLVRERSAVKTRLRALLHEQGIEVPRSLWSKKGLAFVAALSLGDLPGLQRDQMLDQLANLKVRLQAVERLLAARAAKEPAVHLLRSIPGVGIRTAEAVVAYMVKAERFRRNKSVGRYFGIIPCEDSSVKTRMGHITKDGPATVRKLVTEAAWQGIRRDASMRAFFERVCRNDPKRRKIALIATAHRLLRVMHAMLRTGEMWRAQAA